MSRSSAASKPSSAASRFLSFERRFVPALRHFAELPYVAAVRDALPWSFIGLIAGILAFLLLDWRDGVSLPLGQRLAHAYLPSFGIMAATLVVVLAVKYALATKQSIAAIGVASVVAFAASLPEPIRADVDYLRGVGPSGLFLAMVVVGAVAFFAWAALRVVPAGAAPWAGGLVAIAASVALMLLHVSLSAIISNAFVPLGSLGDTYLALLIIVAIEAGLWLVGIHGPAMLAAIVTPVYLVLQQQNTEAFAHHQALPHIVVVSVFLFVFPGGAGATLPLAALFAISRVPSLRKVGRATMLPALVNINEPLLFGVPVILNPYLAFPFVIAPLLLATTTYLAMAHGLVAAPAYYYPSSIPTLISTYLATLDPRAVVLSAINIALAAIVYVPFVRAYERHLEASA